MEIINKKLEAHREYNQKHKDVINAKNREYYKLNKHILLKKNKEYRLINKDSIRLKAKNWRVENKKKKSEMDHKYYSNHKTDHDMKCKSYYQTHKDEVKLNHKEYRLENKDFYREYNKKYYKIHKIRIRNLQNEYIKLRCQEDMSFRLSRVLSNRVWKALTNNLNGGKTKSSKLYGIDVDAIAEKLIKELPQHFEFGKYHADHIIPIACFDLNDPLQLKECFKPENYQWLLAKDNLNKSDKILPEHEPLYLELKNKYELRK